MKAKKVKDDALIRSLKECQGRLHYYVSTYACSEEVKDLLQLAAESVKGAIERLETSNGMAAKTGASR